MASETSNREHVVVEPEGFSHLSWGAIFVGLVLVLSLSWLIHLLGVAIGVSLADTYDSTTIEGGVGKMAAIWIILSWLVAFFVGALICTCVAGILSNCNGMLHGLTVWGLATLAMIALSSYGLSSILKATPAAIRATASGIAVTATGVAGATPQLGALARSALDTQLVNAVQNRLLEQAAEAAADQVPQLSEQEIRNAINNLDQRTLRRMTRDFMDQDSEGAAQLLAEHTPLSPRDAQALVNSISPQREQILETEGDTDTFMQEVQNRIAQQVGNYLARLEPPGKPEVTPQEIRTAMGQLDQPTLQQITNELIAGDIEGAQRILARRTTLTPSQIDNLYQGFARGWEQEVQEYQQAVQQWAESVSDYARTIVWLTLGSSVVALVAAVVGGWLGARRSREASFEEVALERVTTS